MQFGGIPVKTTIDNQDTTNALTYRVAKDGALLTAPANGLTIIDNILLDGFLEINPNAGTGAGNVSFDIGREEELRAKGFL